MRWPPRRATDRAGDYANTPLVNDCSSGLRVQIVTPVDTEHVSVRVRARGRLELARASPSAGQPCRIAFATLRCDCRGATLLDPATVRMGWIRLAHPPAIGKRAWDRPAAGVGLRHPVRDARVRGISSVAESALGLLGGTDRRAGSARCAATTCAPPLTAVPNAGRLPARLIKCRHGKMQ